MLKCTLQDALAEGLVKENLILKRLGAQKHEHAISKLELKCCKLEKQHQQEQHEYRMLQMWLMMSQNQLSAAAWPPTTQVHNPLLFDGYGLMTELNAGSVLSEDLLPSLSSYP